MQTGFPLLAVGDFGNVASISLLFIKSVAAETYISAATAFSMDLK